MTKWKCNICGNEFDTDEEFNEGFSTLNYEYDLCCDCLLEIEGKIRELIYPNFEEDLVMKDSKLKTLKDLEFLEEKSIEFRERENVVFVSDLKAEAVKWINKLETSFKVWDELWVQGVFKEVEEAEKKRSFCLGAMAMLDYFMDLKLNPAPDFDIEEVFDLTGEDLK